MRIEHVKYLLPDYSAGKLEQAEQSLVSDHLQACDLCRSDLDEIRITLAQLETAETAKPSNAYFSSLVPRIRQKLEGRQSSSWLGNPFTTKLVFPFSVAVLAIVLLSSVELTVEEPVNPLKNVVADFLPEDVIDLVAEASRPTLWTTRQAQEIAEKLVAGHVSEEHALRYVLQTDPAESTEQTQELLRELNESQIEQLLQKLGERAIL